MSDRETADQIAALPRRWDKTGKLRVLMVTSRDADRRLIPKEWLIDGKMSWHVAKTEPREEESAASTVSKPSIGHFFCNKRFEGRSSVRRCVTPYPDFVEKLKRCWKEEGERARHWISPAKAAKLAEENELPQLLKKMTDNQEVKSVVKNLLRAA